MKILIIDRYDRRDLAQMDMYQLIAKEHDVYFARDDELFSYIHKVNLIWLGIYHQELTIDWASFILYCKCPVIIDNADNEEFEERNDTVPYQFIRNKIFTSRYLPNEAMTRIGVIYKAPVRQLTWYVNPDRMLNYPKNIDLAFMASLFDARVKLADDIKKIATMQKWTTAIGEYWGQRYVYLLSRSRVVYCDCSRKCLTQKYIEATLCGAVIIGDVPIYPANSLKVIPASVSNLIPAVREALQSEPLTWESPFLSEFNAIIDEARG